MLVGLAVYGPGQLGVGVSESLLPGALQLLPPDYLNRFVFSVFGLTGMATNALCALLVAGSRGQKIPFGLSALVGQFFGLMALGPYFFSRQRRTSADAEVTTSWVFKFFESKILALLLVGISVHYYAVLFGVYGATSAAAMDGEFMSQLLEYLGYMTSDRYVAANAFDFFSLHVASIVALVEDMQRRRLFSNDWSDALTVLSVCLIPALGPSIYLLFRPALRVR
eukprot:Plantae.Rhodophyta-Rhodochaete_pulchella.ctg30660.p1 GENE.Plantae.Rhodophyta-Rhodochaete_pulchella.ctg30660~~Plantae.Rhodophyta-Rhodochaete_pulchella.ctg30660.p1  ORF type:complete len:235 (+),score=24.41 Plantae.Rhodophyta-Rhodochaete_pulchella.ctg30660:34-705(+)